MRGLEVGWHFKSKSDQEKHALPQYANSTNKIYSLRINIYIYMLLKNKGLLLFLFSNVSMEVIILVQIYSRDRTKIQNDNLLTASVTLSLTLNN